MNLTLRPGSSADTERWGTICYEAFKAIADRHQFPPDFSSPQAAVASTERRFSHASYYAVVAELEGRIVGSVFLDERSPIASIASITVDPAAQNRMVGRRLMEAFLQRVAERRCPGVRLIQAAYNTRSLSLYAKLGFEVREPLVAMQGPPLALHVPGYTVRAATMGDIDECNALCVRAHGHDRRAELVEAIERGRATVVEHADRLAGYATGLGFAGHSVGEGNAALTALIGAASEFSGPGFLLPTRNGAMFRWCLDHGLRIVQPMTLMSIGLYNEPQGGFLPSIVY
jgi:ribosomal protein S18 acetylase RimI-like enzyme